MESVAFGRRRNARDLQHTIDTLRRVTSNRRPPTPRTAVPEPHLVVGPVSARRQEQATSGLTGSGPADGRATGLGGSGGVPGADGVESERAPTGVLRRPALVFGDDVPRPELTRQVGAVGEAPAGGGGRPGGPEALPWRRRRAPRPLRLATTAAAAALVGALVTTVVVGGGRSGPPSAVRAQSASSSGTGTVGQRAHPTRGPTGRASSSTASPGGLSVVPTAGSPYHGSVTVPATAYQVTVSVSNACWVQGQDPASGTAVWAGELTAGQSHTFAVSGPLLVELGAADATVSVDGHPLSLPTGYLVPYDLTLTPG